MDNAPSTDRQTVVNQFVARLQTLDDTTLRNVIELTEALIEQLKTD